MMKKEYEKPIVEVLAFVTNEAITDDINIDDIPDVSEPYVGDW